MKKISNEEFNKVKNYELQIMDVIHTICTQNNINYSLFYGSLIGAVRHRGFIPWDDDIDIIMSHDDYLLFKSICKKSLPKNLFLQDNDVEPDSCLPNTAKIRLNNTLLVEHPNANKKMHHGVWVDIFIYNSFNGNLKNITKSRRLYFIYKRRVSSEYRSNKSFKGKIASLIFILFHPFSSKHYKNKYSRFRNKISDTNMTKILMPDSNPNLSKYSIDILKEIELYKFENREYKIIKNYDLILKELYGNYMELPKKEDRVANHSYVKIEL